MSSFRMDNPPGKHIAKVQIKPLLKGMSRDGSPSTSIDLSRSSFEQEELGIYTSHERDSVQGDLYTNFPTRRKLSDFHRRSTSGTSQLSTASSSSMGKPGSQYVHPMRRTPRAYTPPLVPLSRRNSYFESDSLHRGEASEGDLLTQPTLEIRDQYESASSIPKPRLSLHLPDSSFTPLPGGSQTNVTSRASFGYSRDNTSTLDATSPTSRTSLDFVFRSRTRTSMDPVSRAATVQAARQAFEEKEAAKNRKFEEQRIKAEEKQLKRKEKQGHRTSVKDGDIQEKMSSHNTHDVPRRSQSTKRPPNSENWKSQSKSTWILFLTWLRTRIFKFGRKVRSAG
ncbi:uncharacterized protein BDV17DRAFT_41543 [Aspergillus undulatus]|uniref:uncharacterized protein n=1 Tax=Aspergillus undulatus TaxID=1810928 RepID=UPI003CCCEC49